MVLEVLQVILVQGHVHLDVGQVSELELHQTVYIVHLVHMELGVQQQVNVMVYVKLDPIQQQVTE